MAVGGSLISRMPVQRPTPVPGTTRSGTTTTRYGPTAWHEGKTTTESYGPDPMDLYNRFMRGQGAGGTGGGGSLPRVTGADPASRRAAEAAEFGRAKDRVGQATQGLMRAIRGTAQRRGISGSSIEGNMAAQALGRGHGELGEVIRDQAISTLRRGQDIEDRDYAGGITQRGQDLSANAARQNYALDILRTLMARY